MDDPHPVGALGMALLELVGEELLTHQLVEGLVEQGLEREHVVAHRAVGSGQRGPVPLPTDGVLLRLWRASAVRLGVLPLQQDQLTTAIRAAVREGGVDARAVRAADSAATRYLAEEVGRADVLEGEQPTWLDLQHLVDSEERAERSDDSVGVVHHLAQGVDALHLRAQEVVAWTAADAGVPRDAELGEQRQRTVPHLREEVVRRVLRWEAEVVRQATGGAVPNIGRCHHRLGRQRVGGVLPGDRPRPLRLREGHCAHAASTSSWRTLSAAVWIIHPPASVRERTETRSSVDLGQNAIAGPIRSLHRPAGQTPHEPPRSAGGRGLGRDVEGRSEQAVDDGVPLPGERVRVLEDLDHGRVAGHTDQYPSLAGEGYWNTRTKLLGDLGLVEHIDERGGGRRAVGLLVGRDPGPDVALVGPAIVAGGCRRGVGPDAPDRSSDAERGAPSVDALAGLATPAPLLDATHRQCRRRLGGDEDAVDEDPVLPSPVDDRALEQGIRDLRGVGGGEHGDRRAVVELADGGAGRRVEGHRRFGDGRIGPDGEDRQRADDRGRTEVDLRKEHHARLMGIY